MRDERVIVRFELDGNVVGYAQSQGDCPLSMLSAAPSCRCGNIELSMFHRQFTDVSREVREDGQT
jgi:hypothetical protein